LELRPFLSVLLAAVLFGLSAPLAKRLLRDIDPLVLAGLLYLGAFLGLTVFSAVRRLIRPAAALHSAPLSRRDIPWLAGSIVCGGIIGPIALLLGLLRTSGFSASLLLNLEGLMTALIAVLVFGENAGLRLWLALGAMTAAGIFLAWDPATGSFAWSGALLVLLAMAAWGADNNFTRAIADKDAVRIARIKGLAAGAFSVLLALALGRRWSGWVPVVSGLLLGAFSYGLSLVLYIRALAGLGAFRAGAFFSVAPFIGAAASIFILSESPRWAMAPGLLLMAAGVSIILLEKHAHGHRHERLVHAHPHAHADGHHAHSHDGRAALDGPHVHEHVHEEIDHSHAHWPDIHHRHGH
jgi:drug/metabolite transporter (DMT)-like permease